MGANQPDENEPVTPPDGVSDRIFERHVFVCTGGDWCVSLDGDGKGVHARFKQLVAQAGLKSRVRVNHAGCLDQCGYGPMVVVYPDTVWYWGVTPADVDEIVREHLIGGHPVERLRYRSTPGKHKLPRDEHERPVGRPARVEALADIATPAKASSRSGGLDGGRRRAARE